MEATMTIMKPATVMRAFRLAATRAAARTVVTAASVLKDHEFVHSVSRHNRLISWARMTISSWESSRSSLSRWDRQNSGSRRSTMTSTTAMLSFSVPPPLYHRPCPGARSKLVAAELIHQLFEEAVKPVLTDRLPAAGLLREKYLHKVRRRGAHEALRARARPGQLSSRVCVFTVSTCSPKRFK
jgi:hypothetical protein